MIFEYAYLMVAGAICTSPIITAAATAAIGVGALEYAYNYPVSTLVNEQYHNIAEPLSDRVNYVTNSTLYQYTVVPTKNALSDYVISPLANVISSIHGSEDSYDSLVIVRNNNNVHHYHHTVPAMATKTEESGMLSTAFNILFPNNHDDILG